MAENCLNDRFLKEFKIKPCRVKLDDVCFKKIRMTCSVTDEKNVKVYSNLKQTGMNTFSIKIHSKRSNEVNENEIRPAKKGKFSDSTMDAQQNNPFVRDHG